MILMNDVLLTFGIPMYNCEKYIGELLKCFDFECNFNFEVLIVDDGSSDNSYSEVMKYSCDKLRVISKKNGGVSSARNMIIEEANGIWITFVDADDLINFKKYVYNFKKIKSQDEFCICIENESNYHQLTTKRGIAIWQYLIESNLINSPCQRFYRTDILRNNNIRFDDRFSLGEDALFNMQYKFHINKVSFFNDSIYVYRAVNNESLSKKYRTDKLEELMSVNNISLNYCNDVVEKKALAYVRTANCRGCLNDMYVFPSIFNSYMKKLEYVKKIKKNVKTNYCLLNSLKFTLRYWELIVLPSVVIVCLLNIRHMLSRR